MAKKPKHKPKYSPIRTAKENITAMHTLGKYVSDKFNPRSTRNRAQKLAGDAAAYRRVQRGGAAGGLSKRAASYAARLKKGK